MRRFVGALVVGAAIGIASLIAAGTDRAPAAQLSAAPLSGAAVFASDARGNFAIYKAGIALHVLRLSDGRDRLLAIADEEGPVHAELERDGLYYSYNTPAGAKHGRVAFVPLRELTARFG